MSDEDRKRRITHWRWAIWFWGRVWVRDVWLIVVTVLLVISLTRQSTIVENTNASLCALRIDLERRVANAEKFLLDHPRGFAGIPAGSIRVSVDGQRRTIRALSGLKCPAASR